MNLPQAPHSCCNQQEVRKGLWTPEEDEKLFQYLINHEQTCWNKVPERAGLERCGQSCRLRWINYLKPGIKRGNISQDEEILIIRLHTALGNRWSDIAKHLPGRTYNEIKNYWNSTIKKKIKFIPGYIEAMEMLPLKLPQPVYSSTDLNLANEEMVANTPSNQTDSSSSSSSIFMSNTNLMDGLTNSTILRMPPTNTAEAVSSVIAPNAEQGQLGIDSCQPNLVNQDLVRKAPSPQFSYECPLPILEVDVEDELPSSPNITSQELFCEAPAVTATGSNSGSSSMGVNQSVTQERASLPNDLPPPTLDTSSCYLPVLESVEAMAPMEAQAFAVEKDRVLDWDFLEMQDMNEWNDFPSCSSFAHWGQAIDPQMSGKGNSSFAYWGQPIDPQISRERSLSFPDWDQLIDPQMSGNGSSGFAYWGQPFVPQMSGEESSSFANWDQCIDPQISGEGSSSFPGWNQTIDPLMSGEGIAPASSTAAFGLYSFPPSL